LRATETKQDFKQLKIEIDTKKTYDPMFHRYLPQEIIQKIYPPQPIPRPQPIPPPKPVTERVLKKETTNEDTQGTNETTYNALGRNQTKNLRVRQ
jgi:hypothetical protein